MSFVAENQDGRCIQRHLIHVHCFIAQGCSDHLVEIRIDQRSGINDRIDTQAVMMTSEKHEQHFPCEEECGQYGYLPAIFLGTVSETHHVVYGIDLHDLHGTRRCLAHYRAEWGRVLSTDNDTVYSEEMTGSEKSSKILWIPYLI